MAAPHDSSGHRRRYAVLALVAGSAALVAALVAVAQGSIWRLLIVAAGLVLAVAGAWYIVATRGMMRIVGGVMAVAGLAALILGVATSPSNGWGLELSILLLVGSAWAAREALSGGAEAPVAVVMPGTAVEPSTRPVLIMNRWSGGGKVEKFALVEECKKRGIEPVVLERGDDLLELAENAIAGGADVIGMAGGDGSQALVATIAAKHGVPHVCIPAGTRNHFALDLGLDRDDVIGALDAYGEATERRIDLATVNGRVFVNNASMGVYAKIVQSPEYRDAKMKTAAAMLPDMLGPDAERFDLRFVGPDGEPVASSHMILVSNNPYELHHLDGRGSRPRIDTGTLGIVSAQIQNAREAVQFTQLEAVGRARSFSGWLEWETPRFQIDSSAPVEIGIDGEATRMEPPLIFESRPGALRVRIPTHAPGVSPAAVQMPETRQVIPQLIAMALGKPPPV